MNQDRFTETHRESWATLSSYLDELEKLPGKRKTSLADFPALYRRVCHDLGVARARAYSRSLTENLHRLVLKAHQRVYGTPQPLGRRMLAFLREGFPSLVRAEWRYVLASTLLLFAPLIILLVTVQYRPEAVYTVIQPKDVRSFEAMYNPDLRERLGREREADSDFLMLGHYIRNNTSIGFQTFAGGMLAGLGTTFYLVFNGVYLGAVAGHLTAIGYHTPFWSFVAGHSAPELTAIVISGAAGLRIGMAILAPGRRTRRRALRDAAAIGVNLVYGAAGLFLLAAFVEAFWSSIAWMPPEVKYLVGTCLWVLLLAYLALVGRGRGA
jgi:uncharacterized membrane protein SpoIIM required for sporulation